jgi:hypothetical protein
MEDADGNEENKRGKKESRNASLPGETYCAPEKRGEEHEISDNESKDTE